VFDLADKDLKKVLFVIGDEWYSYKWLNWQFDKDNPNKLDVRFITDETEKEPLDKELLKGHLITNGKDYSALLFDLFYGELVTVAKEIIPDMRCVLLDNSLPSGVHTTASLKVRFQNYSSDIKMFDAVIAYGEDSRKSISYLEKAVLGTPSRSKPKEI